MKNCQKIVKIIINLLCTIVLLSLSFQCKKNHIKQQEKVKLINIFPKDSGFYVGNNPQTVMNLINPIINKIDIQNKNEVNIKYFRNNDKSVIGCLFGYSPFEGVLFTFSEKNDSIYTVYEIISHVNCCTNDYFNFTKHDNFYTFEFCASGSGYCQKDMLFFSDLTKVDDMKRIVLDIQSWNETGKISLTSKYEISNDTIFVNYKEKINRNRFKEYNLTFVYKYGDVVLLDSINDINFLRMIGCYKDF